MYNNSKLIYANVQGHDMTMKTKQHETLRPEESTSPIPFVDRHPFHEDIHPSIPCPFPSPGNLR